MALPLEQFTEVNLCCFYCLHYQTVYLQSCTEIDETQVLQILKSPLIFTPFLSSVGELDSSTETKQIFNEPLFTGLLISRTHLQIHSPSSLTP